MPGSKIVVDTLNEGKYQFRLVAANGKTVSTSTVFDNRRTCHRGISSFQTAAVSAQIDRNSLELLAGGGTGQTTATTGTKAATQKAPQRTAKTAPSKPKAKAKPQSSMKAPAATKPQTRTAKPAPAKSQAKQAPAVITSSEAARRATPTIDENGVMRTPTGKIDKRSRAYREQHGRSAPSTRPSTTPKPKAQTKSKPKTAPKPKPSLTAAQASRQEEEAITKAIASAVRKARSDGREIDLSNLDNILDLTSEGAGTKVSA